MSIREKAKQRLQATAMSVVQKAVALAPDAWVPGGHPDPLIHHRSGLIGAPVPRIDAPQKVAGQARFAAEVPLDGMLYAALVYSTIAKGRLASLDTSAAAAAPGVALVMTHRNAPRLQPLPTFTSNMRSAAQDSIPVLQDDRIHWNGQPVALVLAETQEQADYAKSMLHPVYEPEHAVTRFAEAKAAGLETGAMMGMQFKDEINDAEKVLATSPVKVDEVYSTPRHNHNALELHAVTVIWEDDNLTVHDATQKLAHTAWSLAHAFGLDEKQVRVLSPYVGGGFGGKGLWQHHLLAAAAARLAGRPVRLVLTREGVYRIVGGRTLTEQRVAIGARPDGKFEALIHIGKVAMTPHNNMPEPLIMGTRGRYAARALRLEVQAARVDMMANTFMRAPGEAVGTFALESAVDELAARLDMDPIELRLRNEPDKEPTSGLPFSLREVEKIFRDGAERFGWSRRNQTPGQRREGEWLIGTGVASGTYPHNRMPGGAARLTVTRDGHATVEFAGQEMGMGTATVHAQVTAERLGLPMTRVAAKYGDSLLPGRVMAVGSAQTTSFGAAIAATHKKLVKELTSLAGNDSPLAGLSPDEVGGLNAGLAKLDDPTRHESYASILSRAGRMELTVEAEAPPPLETMHWSMHSHSAMFCEVKVNAVTGEIRVSRILGSFACGRILNARTASSQFRGAIIMGIGLALMEETQFDERNGRIMNASLSEYHVPVHMDVPEIEVMWTDTPDPHAPMGAHGVGEIGITGTAAAIANAVFNATGKRIRDLPITLDKLL
ncbi:xanthine dehydrogenase family protein molybdopterin-binding subunit [Mesorhizobium sp. B2-4-13]|nr:xanthine dehydrogenase family protein molybdopterin-binding subunit [Mesorhizobium sp. B2-4-13]